MSHSLEQKQKESIGRRHFNISSSEKLIDHLSCKYKSKLSASGSLWIFKWHICYLNNLFGTETKIRIRISDIAKISPSGNSSIEILCIKNNESHKFIGFPSKERRDTTVQFITNQHTHYKKNMAASKDNSQSITSPSVTQTTNKHSHSHSHSHSINDIQKHTPKSNSISRPHSRSIEDISQTMKSEDNIECKTAHIHPKPAAPSITAPLKPDTNVNTNINIDAKTIGNGIHGHDNNNNNINIMSDMSTRSYSNEQISKLKTKSTVSPARYLHPSNQQIITQKSRNRRKSSGGINYNNPPTFRLQSIHSQHSLQLMTPQANDSDGSDDENIQIDKKLKRQLSNKDSGMDTLDIFNLERSLSIHSDDTHQNRLRSWSDSDMPFHGDASPTETKIIDDKDDTKHNKSPFAGGWLSIFQKTKGPSHTKQNKRKNAHVASSSLGTIHKPQKHVAPKVNRARSTQDPERDLPKVVNILQSKSVPEDINECNDNNNTIDSTMPSSLTQYIDESYALTPMHLGSFQNLEWKSLYLDDFWTSPALLFHEAFSDAFIKNMHHTRGSTGLKIGEWNIYDDEKTIDGQPITYVRNVEYISKIKDPPPFMPSKTEVYETQRFRFYGSNRVVVDAAISTPNIKYGDYFLICQRYIFTINDEDNNKTHMDCSISFKWVKKTWFEKIITSKATSEAEEGMAMWCSKLQEIFKPKISKQEMFVRKMSNKDLLPSPKRRIIDKKVIDYFHTPRRRKDIIINDWVKPIGQIFIDMIKTIFKPSSWIKLYNNLLQINDVEQHDNLITMKHGLMVIILIIGLFIMCNICWMTMWYWYSSSLNNIIVKQNEILKQQTKVFQQLLMVLKTQSHDNILECNSG